jgi:hypothetical protein
VSFTPLKQAALNVSPSTPSTVCQNMCLPNILAADASPLLNISERATLATQPVVAQIVRYVDALRNGKMAVDLTCRATLKNIIEPRL